MAAERPQFEPGDIAQLRKQHPCGESRWEVLRTGADVRIKCLGCGRLVMLPRLKFEKSVKKIIPRAEFDAQE